MFASIGLFASIPCPDLPSCPRTGFCIYSHTITAPPIPVHEPASSTKTLPLKRKVDRPPSSSTDTSAEAHSAKHQRTTLKDSNAKSIPTTAASAPVDKKTPLAAMVAAKQRREALESKSTAPPTLKPQARGIGPVPIIVNRSLQTKTPASAASTSKTSSSKLSIASTLTASGPPVLKIDLRAHSKPQFRQSVATQYYNEFRRIYAPLGEPGSKLATAHAVDQEKSVHSKTNQGSYRGLAATVLQRLKKRPVAVDEEDVGIDGEWVDPSIRIKEAKKTTEIWKAIGDYISTKEALEKNGYPVEIPSSGTTPLPLEPTLVCDRCHQKFEVPSDPESWVRTACLYHDRKLRNIIQVGEKIRVFACCDSPVGSSGCREGPHVFKEDSLEALHHRTRFIETPAKTKSGKEPQAVVAMDCEMGYTTGGFELIRISVVDGNGETIMDELVRPENTVLDLNSRFSGITSLDDAKYTLTEARDRFLELINRDTVIIGHSLENDFKVLRLVHNQVVDTAILYPHPQNYMEYRYSLQILAKQHLGINIQESETGHDSFEDAKTCLDLVQLRIKKDKGLV